MRLTYVAMVAAFFVTGCSPRHENSLATGSSAAGATVDTVATRDVPNSPLNVILKAQPTNYPKAFGQAWEQEAVLIDVHPGFVKHVEERMKVYHEGKPIADEPQVCEKCDSFMPYFAGTVQLKSPVSGQIEPYAVVAEVYEEDTLFAIPHERGRLGELTGLPVASPDGRWIASGDYNEYGEVGAWGEGVLTITDWTGKIKPIEFGPLCRPNAWSDNDHFTALCVNVGDYVASFEATAARNKKGDWTLTVTRLIEVHGNGGSTPSFSAPTVFAGRPVAPSL